MKHKNGKFKLGGVLDVKLKKKSARAACKDVNRSTKVLARRLFVRRTRQRWNRASSLRSRSSFTTMPRHF